MNVFDLCASLSLDSSDYEEGLNISEKTANSFGSKLSSTLSKAGKIGAVAIGAVSAEAVVVTKKFADGIASVAEYGDNIDKMSQKLGISATAYQEWDFIAQHAGTSVEGLQTSMKTLSNAVVDGSDAFEKLGISIEDAQSMSTEDLFSAVISGLQGMEEGTERTALASDLLGKSATELGALLNMSAEETEAMRQEAHDLGGVLDDEAIKSSANFADSLQNLQTAFSGVSNGLFSQFLPAVTTAMDGITAIVGGDESGIGKISQGVDEFVVKLSDMLPKVMDFAIQLIETLAKAILENLPKLVNSAVEIVMKLTDIILNNLPMIIEVAVQIIHTIATGLIEAIPDLIPAIIDVVVGIVTYLLSNVDLLINVALKLIIALGEGLVNAIPKLVESVPKIITALVKGLAEGIKEIASVGGQLIEGLWNGISDKISWITDKIKGFGESVIGSIKSIFGIHSPSRVMRDEVGKMLALGIGEGWSDEFADVKNDIESDLNFETNLSKSATPIKRENYEMNGGFDNVSLVEAFTEALESLKFEWDDRNLGRMVQAYAR